MELLDTAVLSGHNAFKDAKPSETVKRIKGILEQNGIKTVENWKESGVPNCYSLRVSVFGTQFGTNGKGVTKELSLASGYGELMERLQLGLIFKEDQQKERYVSINFTNDDQYTKKSVKELIERNPKWYSMYAEHLFRYSGIRLSEEALLKQFADPDGFVSVIPYYCVTSDTTEYMPVKLGSVYSTNGCAAGNTKEESLVQAISEVVERHYMLEILERGLAVPEIPEEVLKTHKVAYEIITFLRGNGFQVIVKDCSLGGRFPVVCVCIVDKNTGRYHTHFGAAPKLETAIERTLTESFQGRNIENVGKYEDFCSEGDVLKSGYLVQALTRGTSERTLSFFMDKADTSYNENVGFRGNSNPELLKECLSFFKEQGLDVLIRDQSCLGFPTYQVIVPGYSETFRNRLLLQKDETQFDSNVVQKVFRDPTAASVDEVFEMIACISQFEKRNKRGATFAQVSNLPLDLSRKEDSFLYLTAFSHVYYTLGMTGNAINEINKLLPVAKPEDVEYLICVKRYLFMLNNGYDQQATRSMLSYFHKEETVDELYSYITQDKNPLDRVVLHCSCQCSPQCKLYEACKKRDTDCLVKMIRTKRKALDQTQIIAHLREL